MKKIIIVLLLAVSLLAVAGAVYAQTPLENLQQVGPDAGYSDQTSPFTLFSVVGTLIRTFFMFLGTILLVIILYAGFRWMTAGGNEDQVSEAKKWLRNAIIGLAIIMFALAITYFIGEGLGGATSENYPNFP